MSSLFSELKERQVIKVGAVYLIVGWIILQVADLVLDNIGAPAWVMQTLMLLMLLGLPIALILAWAFEVTRDGVHRTDSGSNEKVFYSIVGVFLVSIGGFYAYQLTEPENTSVDGAVAVDNETEIENASIAVLPFESFSEEASDEYFADGLADTLLHKLAQIPSLTVIARNSSFQFKGSNKDVREIGQILQVAFVLEGSVQRQGNQVRIIAQLVDTSDGAHIWSQTYDDTLANIFEVQDRIAQELVGQLFGSLSDIEYERLARHGTTNTDAYELLLRANAIRLDRDLDASSVTAEADEVIRLLKQAIEADPNFAHAWSALADRYDGLAFYESNSARRDEYASLAKESAEKAIEIDPEYDEPYVGLGFAYWRMRNAIAAAENFRKALELNSNNTGALSGLGLAIMRVDPHEAHRVFRESERRNPQNRLVRRQISFALLGLGRVDEAFVTLSEAVDRFPTVIFYYEDLSDLSVDVYGRYDLGSEWLSKLLMQSPSSHTALERLSENWFAVGDTVRAQVWLNKLTQAHPDSDDAGYINVRLLLNAGEYDQAMEAMRTIIPSEGVDRTHAVLTLVACQQSGNSACVAQTVARIEAMLQRLEDSGFGQAGRYNAIPSLAKSLLADSGHDVDAELQTWLDESESWPMLFRGGQGFRSSRAIRAALFARLGRVEEAIAELNRTLKIDDGGIIATDVFGMPLDQSIFLETLHGNPVFEEWLVAFRARRDAMRNKMIELEASGEIARSDT